jgi:hypothetical protein
VPRTCREKLEADGKVLQKAPGNNRYLGTVPAAPDSGRSLKRSALARRTTNAGEAAADPRSFVAAIAAAESDL